MELKRNVNYIGNFENSKIFKFTVLVRKPRYI